MPSENEPTKVIAPVCNQRMRKVRLLESRATTKEMNKKVGVMTKSKGSNHKKNDPMSDVPLLRIRRSITGETNRRYEICGFVKDSTRKVHIKTYYWQSNLNWKVHGDAVYEFAINHKMCTKREAQEFAASLC